jgi:GNAT superfamily N-acetyltransferase
VIVAGIESISRLDVGRFLWYSKQDRSKAQQVDDHLERYPKTVTLKGNLQATLRPLVAADEKAFHEFFCTVPETERLLFKHRVIEPEVIHDWCQRIDYGKILPLLAIADGKIVADASLHQQLGGWKRHIGRISVVVHPGYRGRGLARALIQELIDVASDAGLEKLEAEFLGNQQAARLAFAELGFSDLLVLPDYVKDMQAIAHDYVLMGRHIITDEEYAGTG